MLVMHTQVRKYAGKQVSKYAGKQVRRYASTNDASTQVRKCAGTLVRRFSLPIHFLSEAIRPSEEISKRTIAQTPLPHQTGKERLAK